jgi:ectoine hydroxylase-related dioxygenase (phytanoyl-CoA dioxygenase family)
MTTPTPAQTEAASAILATDYPLEQAQIDQYRREGFIQLNEVLTGEALRQLRDAVATAVDAERSRDLIGRPVDGPPRTPGAYEQIFIQKVNLWTRYPAVKSFVTSRRLGNLAARLSGRPVRIWHDQALFKEPHTGAKTPWHQDAVYWPHQNRWDQITIWIALKDATIRNGCMSFVGGTHALGPLPAISLGNPQDLFASAPHLKPVKPTICELKAGSVTFHNGLTFHYAGPNKTDAMREAFAIIYMPDGTIFTGDGHLVTDPLKERGLKAGDPLNGEMFP